MHVAVFRTRPGVPWNAVQNPPAPSPSTRMRSAVPDAARLAHTFRNYLTVIGGFTELLLSELTDPAQRELAAEIGEAVSRATTSAACHLATARTGACDPLDIAGYLATSRARLRAIVGPGIDIEIHRPSQPLYVRIPPTSLDDVIMNLAANARDAMPRGGSIVVSVQEETHEDGFPICRLSVADTGHGLPADVAENVFQPFFTTKPEAGCGIGLFEVRRILADAGGYITVGPANEGGTEFQAHFPVA